MGVSDGMEDTYDCQLVNFADLTVRRRAALAFLYCIKECWASIVFCLRRKLFHLACFIRSALAQFAFHQGTHLEPGGRDV